MVKLKNQFPLYKNDGIPVIKLETEQVTMLSKLKKDIASNKLHLIENSCLCGNEHPENDIVITEKDRYGLNIPQLLCSKCGLIRSKFVFDDESNNEFYKTYYRAIYTRKEPNEQFFNDQQSRGQYLYNLIYKHIQKDNILNVVEIGCGAGGILKPFYDNGKNVHGYDFDESYLSYGKTKGLDLNYGDVDLVADKSADLIILSHVMEHFIHPIDEMYKIIAKVKPSKYLIVEVPGIFWISEGYFNPLTYFQNAHVYNYYFYYLTQYYKQLGLNILYGDERCTFILQKPDNWKPQTKEYIFDESLTKYPAKIAAYLLKCNKIKFFNIKYFKILIIRIVKRLGLKGVINFIFRKNI